MAELNGMRLAVAGAGVFGLCAALRAAAAGANVEVWDPSPLGDNASGVAAGMIAPVGEALFDVGSGHRLPLFRIARDAWNGVVDLAPELVVDRSGTILSFYDQAMYKEAEGRLSAMRADFARSSAAPLSFTTPEDWRVEATAALNTLRGAVETSGGRFQTAFLKPEHLAGFDAVVLAAGYASRDFMDLAPELAILQPIKGQILRFAGGDSRGPTIRANDVYLAPRPSGVLAGASMEPGLSDRSVDPAILEAIHSRAVGLAPSLADVVFQGAAGVRAATPDGLPLAGPSSRPGLFLATGARRNGWLFGPLVSGIIVSYLSGGDGGPFAAAFDPRRDFTAS
jgi:glycine oxidase